MKWCICHNKLACEDHQVLAIPQTFHKFLHASQEPFAFPDILELSILWPPHNKIILLWSHLCCNCYKISESSEFLHLIKLGYIKKLGISFFFLTKKWLLPVPLPCHVAFGHYWTLLDPHPQISEISEDDMQLLCFCHLLSFHQVKKSASHQWAWVWGLPRDCSGLTNLSHCSWKEEAKFSSASSASEITTSDKGRMGRKRVSPSHFLGSIINFFQQANNLECLPCARYQIRWCIHICFI